MAIASGIEKLTVFLKQSALGSASAGAGGEIARRTSSVMRSERDTFESNEIVDHHQSTGVTYGLQKAEGKIDGLLSAGTFSEFLGSIVEQDFVAGSIHASSTITYAGTTPNWTATGTGFWTTGLKKGDVIRATTGSVSGNNSRNFLITNVTDTVITFRALDGATVTGGASTTTVLTVQGKKALAPITAHTKDYYTIEEWYATLSRSETFIDMRVGQIDVSLPAGDNATISVDFVGLSRVLGGSQILTSPTSTTTSIMTAINGIISIDGTVQDNASAISFTITNSATNAGAVIGSNFGQDVTTGRIQVSGTFTALFDAVALQTLYDNETNTSINVALTGDNTGTADFMSFTMDRIKITGDTPDDGEKAIMRTYPFTAEYNSVGGAGTATDQTIISIQDSAAA